MPRPRDREAGLIDMMSTGLAYGDLGALTDYKAVSAPDPDAAPGLPDHPVVRTGDIWELGEHRLLCGDSTDRASVRRLLGNDRPHLMITDPPYGVEYDPNWRNEAGRALDGTTQRIKTGNVVRPIGPRAVGAVFNDSRADWTAAWDLFPGDVAYVWHADRHASEVQRSVEAAGFVIRCQIIWRKSRFVIGRGDYHWQHEPCWYCVRKGARGHWNAGRDQTTVWDIAHTVSETGHGTQKPVECMRRPIENNSALGDLVYEPFCGSGTTVVAAELTGRRCLAIEINPLYAYVAIARWQNIAGKPASLDGEPFAEVVRRRRDEPAGAVQVLTPEPAEDAPPPIPEDFDPVLMEVICDRWCPPGGMVFDAYPSGVRLLVAEHLRREYHTEPCDADLALFAPPPGDLSLEATRIAACLRQDRFAVAVVADRRREDGSLAGFPASVTAAFREAGLTPCDEAVYDSGESYSHVLVFAKGSVAAATAACEDGA